MPTIAAQRASEKIEADIEFARSLYLAAVVAIAAAASARFVAVATADKAQNAYEKAYDEAEIASTRLQTLCDKLANLQAR